MKKRLILVPMLAMLFLSFSLTGCFLFNKSENSSSSGDGGVNYTLISNSSDLRSLEGKSGNFKLAIDFDISETNWIPINNFSGLLNGDGKTISGLTISGNSANVGLFSTLKGSVKNLTLSAVNITSSVGAGIAGALCGTNSGLIENVTISGVINMPNNNSVGGIAGVTNKNIISSTNRAVITAYSNVGGIAGDCEEKTFSISDLKNEGQVSGYENVGGIFGKISLHYNEAHGTLTTCENEGEITGTGNNIGGIVGYQTKSGSGYYQDNSTLTISSCVNYGLVTGKDNTGGIIGFGYRVKEISASSNVANITGGNYVGGYVGRASGANIKTATNNNTISGKAYVGGIAGLCGFLENCKNTGAILSSAVIIEESVSVANVGGIAGYATGAKTSTNSADIAVTTNGVNVGGIIGRCHSQDGLALDGNVNDGTISGYNNVGGIVGAMTLYYNGLKVSLTGCENKKPITGSGANIGGIIGIQTKTGSGYYQDDSYLTISSSVNHGVITGKDNVGGIIGFGYRLKELSGSSNAADITGDNFVGGYVGKASGANIKAATNDNTITGKAYLGGIAGYAGFLENCTNNGNIISSAVIIENSVSFANVGGIAGYATGAKMCTNNAQITVTTNGENVGGIIGKCDQADGVALDGNFNNGKISGYRNVGGIVGTITVHYTGVSATITNCQNTKAITAVQNNVGGIVGLQARTGSGLYQYNSTVTISNSSNSGNITGTNNVGGIIGNGQCTKKDENIWLTNTNIGTIIGVNNKGDLFGSLS